MQTETIAMLLLIAIATIGAIGISIEMGIQPAQAQASGNPHIPGFVGNPHTIEQGCNGNPHNPVGIFRSCPGAHPQG